MGLRATFKPASPSMSLKAQLAELCTKAEQDLPAGVFARLKAEAAAVRASGAVRGALRAGASAPNFRLEDGVGGTVRLTDLLNHGPVAICFYRGDWCRFCALTLAALAEISGDVTALGASLVAIAPQPPQSRRLAGESTPPFPLLVDTGARVTKSFGLAFSPAEALEDAYAALGRPLIDACRTAALPTPAVYVVAPSGTIIFSYLDSDFTSRLEPTEILVALRRLRSPRMSA